MPLVICFRGTHTYYYLYMRRSVKIIDANLEFISIARGDFHRAVSKFIANGSKELFALGPRDVQVHYNYIFPQTDGLPMSQRKDVVFFGTLNETKGVTRVIAAWDIIRRVVPEHRLHIYGKDWRTKDGVFMTDVIKDKFREDTLSNVIFHGHVEREKLLEDILPKTRLVILPSTR